MKLSRKDRAGAWVAEAIDAGMDPKIIVQSAGSAFPGKAMLHTRVVGSRTVPRPDGLDREIEGALMDRGRVRDGATSRRAGRP